MPLSGYTPQEVAAMSGVRLSVVQKAITTRKIPARMDRRTHRRRLDTTALLALALVRSLPDEVHLAPNDAYRLLKRARIAGEPASGNLAVGDLVRIDTGKALAEVRRRMALYEHARERIVCDPDIMGGAPTIRGTRITAQAVHGRIEAGDTIDSIIEDYPYLDRETVEAASVYAQANPPRGRPAGKLWRHVS
jgi:uncharacterized protein (DUF433 family)